MTERTILIVDSKKVLFETVRDYFARSNLLCTVLWSGSEADALQTVLKTDVNIIYADHGSPGAVDGLEIIRAIRQEQLPIRVILGVEPVLESGRTEALSAGCDHYLMKPFSVDKFCKLLVNMLQPNQGFRGRIIGMRLEDVIQMFCYGKDSILLTVLSGKDEGRIYIDDGEVIHAEWRDLAGVDAFYEIVGWKDGRFLSQVTLTVPERSVYMDWQTLLMEGLRERDEIRHALGPEDTGTMTRQVSISGDGGRGAVPTASTRIEPDGLKRIMIVDDSRLIRKIVQEILEDDPGVRVVGYATNGLEALAKLDEIVPDLILLDWDMPVMKGSTALMHIMIRSPGPVVILSGFLGGVGANPFDLICLGAADFMRKPQSKWRTDGRADDLIRRIKRASEIRFDRIRRVRIPPIVPGKETARPVGGLPCRFLTVIGSSIGACADLIRTIPALPEDLPSAVVCLHDMQKDAIAAFVDYLNHRSKIIVRAVTSGDPLEDGVCYIHPAGVPLELAGSGEAPSLRVTSGIPFSRALDHFLTSATKLLRRNVMAALLSGGPDIEVEGLRTVKKADGITVVQDPTTCVDPRLAEAALQEGIVDHRCPAEKMAETLAKLIR